MQFANLCPAALVIETALKMKSVTAAIAGFERPVSKMNQSAQSRKHASAVGVCHLAVGVLTIAKQMNVAKAVPAYPLRFPMYNGSLFLRRAADLAQE